MVNVAKTETNTTISNNSGRTKSIWMDVPVPALPSLEKDLLVDVCIVGGGIAGLTCAYTLAKQGKSVVVLDQGAIAGGQTARTTAHLTWALDDRYYELERLFGIEGARLAAESHAASIDYIEKIIQEEDIDCDFSRLNGYLFVPPEDSKDILDKELAAIQKTGMKVEKLKHTPFSTTFDTGPCLQFSRQGEFHILKYLNGLIKAIIKYGGKIYSNTHVNKIEDGSPCIISTDTGAKVTAKATIVATCSPISDGFPIHMKQGAYRTYVIGGRVPKGTVAKGIYWDTPDPYHYLRIQPHPTDEKSDWFIVGGEDHKTGQDKEYDEKFDHLEEWTRLRVPSFGKVEYRWSGQVFEPIDALAFIGRDSKESNKYIVTGDSGNGMTHGTIAGMLIPDLILGKKNPWEELYSPSRKTLLAAEEFLKESTNVALQYLDWVTPGEKKAIDELSPDEGIILREGIHKVAVYKDAKNNVHVVSAACTHLGGCVRWNHVEKSWDCPCHGSRFDGYGNPITGPAFKKLPPAKIDSN